MIIINKSNISSTWLSDYDYYFGKSTDSLVSVNVQPESNTITTKINSTTDQFNFSNASITRERCHYY